MKLESTLSGGTVDGRETAKIDAGSVDHAAAQPQTSLAILRQNTEFPKGARSLGDGKSVAPWQEEILGTFGSSSIIANES